MTKKRAQRCTESPPEELQPPQQQQQMLPSETSWSCLTSSGMSGLFPMFDPDSYANYFQNFPMGDSEMMVGDDGDDPLSFLMDYIDDAPDAGVQPPATEDTLHELVQTHAQDALFASNSLQRIASSHPSNPPTRFNASDTSRNTLQASFPTAPLQKPLPLQNTLSTASKASFLPYPVTLHPIGTSHKIKDAQELDHREATTRPGFMSPQIHAPPRGLRLLPPAFTNPLGLAVPTTTFITTDTTSTTQPTLNPNTHSGLDIPTLIQGTLHHGRESDSTLTTLQNPRLNPSSSVDDASKKTMASANTLPVDMQKKIPTHRTNKQTQGLEHTHLTPDSTLVSMSNPSIITPMIVSSSDTDSDMISRHAKGTHPLTLTNHNITSTSSKKGRVDKTSTKKVDKVPQPKKSLQDDVKTLLDPTTEESFLLGGDEEGEDRTVSHRERNREHARNTRLRKKAYVENLKKTLDELCKERDALLLERSEAAKSLVDSNQQRIQVLLSFFALRATCEKRRNILSSIMDENISCVFPITPYRSFPTSEVQVSKCQRTILGIDGMIADSASLQVLLNTLVDRARFPDGVVQYQYEVIAEEAVTAGNLMMIRWSLITTNLVSLGARREIHKVGMMSARFNSGHKIMAMELMFDVMAFMLQLKQCTGNQEFAIVPNTIPTCQGFHGIPMVITMAERPYTIIQVNRSWEVMTGWAGEDVVGKASCKILQGPLTDRKEIEKLMTEVLFKRPARCALVNYSRGMGQIFSNFLNVYPLSTDSKITHYVGLTQHFERISGEKCSDTDGINILTGPVSSRVNSISSEEVSSVVSVLTEHENEKAQQMQNDSDSS